jgi:tRNA pseudouridine55 synthase
MADVHGILNLYKPSGPTSHDCVGRVRRVFGIRRVGHAGTLDPMATGVLLMGLGNGTRVLEYLQGLPKTYLAELRFGIATDTQDITGKVIRSDPSAACDLTAEGIRSALCQFTGEIRQIPPMFSAIKQGGKKLYELARKGESVEREARPVTVYALDLLEFQPGPEPSARLRVQCSAGAYIRTLCHDLGESLSCGATMTALEREAIGPFTAFDATPLDDLTDRTPLVPLAMALEHLPAVVLTDAEARRLTQGQFVTAPEGTPDGANRVLNEAGELLAIAIVHGHGEARLLAPEKVFPQSGAGV